MKYEELIERKRKRGPRRFVRVLVTIIFIIIVASLVFYSIDNPSFMNNIKERMTSFYNPDTKDNTITGNANSTASSSTGIASTQEPLTTGNENSFLGKIMNYFKNKFDNTENDNFPAKIKINFYFSDIGENNKFISEKRTITAGDTKTAVFNAIQELLKGPEKTYHFPVIPPGTKLLDVEILENLAKINLSEEFLNNSLDSGILDDYVIYTIVDTVTGIQGVEGVIFLVDGKVIKQYGNVDLSIPAIRNEDYLAEDEN